MENKRRIYLLDSNEFSPETIAVTFAKTSRSPESFLQIASELNESKSAEFNEKWVVGYGHSSVAEHAVLHIAVENISRLAAECLESNRLASYTEKSTRYQTWNAGAFYVPEEFQSPSLQQEYTQTCVNLLNTYQSLIPSIIEQLEKDYPPAPNESTSAWNRRVRALAIDNCRFLLPSAVLANVGMTINARALEHALVKMLSHPLSEVRRIGVETKAVATQSIPTLLKYADADETLMAAISPDQLPEIPPPAPENTWCRLIYSEPDAEDRILAAYLYRLKEISYAQSLGWIRQASRAEKSHLAEILLSSHNPHSIPLRELEHVVLTFDVQLDQGAFYEVKRHRMMTLTPQMLTANLGYALPKVFTDSGQQESFCNAMDQARSMYGKLAKFSPQAASYIVPNAFNRRFLITSNLRSLLHFIQLRSSANAHFSVRRLAQCMAKELKNVFPLFAEYIPNNPSETVSSIESAYFQKL